MTSTRGPRKLMRLMFPKMEPLAQNEDEDPRSRYGHRPARDSLPENTGRSRKGAGMPCFGLDPPKRGPQGNPRPGPSSCPAPMIYIKMRGADLPFEPALHFEVVAVVRRDASRPPS
jgi:hypothetical protein